MIQLKRNEEVDIFQVELALKIKTKQSPFISILILAQEQEYVSAETLQRYLLKSLPLRACENLLMRLEQQGYIVKSNPSHLYQLTELGERSAIDESFWIGEKGVYNVYISKSNLIQQKIIRTEKVERAESDKDNKVILTPGEIRKCEKQTLNINKTEVLFEDVEGNCFQLKPIKCILEIHAQGNETLLKLSKDNQLLFQSILDLEENILQEELLSSCNDFDYDEDKKAILSAFSKDNLSFIRKVKIARPFFMGYEFNSVELENVHYIPNNKRNAEPWLNELLYRGIDRYFLDDNSFGEFANDLAAPIKAHFNVAVPTRKDLVELFSERDDAFYQIAKLEIIDSLNY